MLTPRFTLSQDADFVTVTIHAPFTNVAATEVFMEERDLRFFSSPYFLRLHLPGEVEENDDASANYDAATNCFVVRAPKKVKGEDFKGLDMISNLLVPPVSEKKCGGDIQEVTLGGDDGEEWFFQQELPKEEEAQRDLQVEDQNSYRCSFTV